MTQEPSGDSAPDRARFVELLPWYVNGSLSGEPLQWIEHYIAAHPEVRKALSFEAVIAEQVAAVAKPVSPEVGWSELNRLVDQEQSAAKRRHETRSRGRSRWNLGALRDWFNAPRMAWAMTVLVALQAGFIGFRWSGDQEPAQSYRSSGALNTPVIRIQFAESATEREIRGLLLAEGAVIVRGPSQLGEYDIIPRSRPMEALLAALRASPIVMDAAVVQGSAD